MPVREVPDISVNIPLGLYWYLSLELWQYRQSFYTKSLNAVEI